VKVRVIEASVAKEAWCETDVERIEYISANYERERDLRVDAYLIGHVTFLSK
jgi:hypothetical protein